MRNIVQTEIQYNKSSAPININAKWCIYGSLNCVIIVYPEKIIPKILFADVIMKMGQIMKYFRQKTHLNVLAKYQLFCLGRV